MNFFRYICILTFFSLSCSKAIICEIPKEIDCEKWDGYHKFIYDPIIIDEECNCIVAGKVKYLLNCETKALVYYGSGECDNTALKISCKDGNCFDQNGNPYQVQEFTIDCNGNSIQNGEVNANELDDLFDPTTGPQP